MLFQVYLSVGAGCWVCPRNAEGIPIDTLIHRRVWKLFPAFLNRIMRRVSEANFNHTEFCIRPARGPIHYTGTVNDDLGSRIASGKIKVVSGTVKFLPNGAKLDDGTEIQDIDAIIFATGFRPDHSLLGKTLEQIVQHSRQILLIICLISALFLSNSVLYFNHMFAVLHD